LISSTLECKLLHIRVRSGTEVQNWKQKGHDDARLKVAATYRNRANARELTKSLAKPVNSRRRRMASGKRVHTTGVPEG
jgi:hypothetical protein